MEIKKFEGFKGLFKDFWGFSDQDMLELCGRTPEQMKEFLGDFWDKPVVMVDDVHSPWLLVGHKHSDLKLNEVHGFKCVDLATESFSSRLFLASDVDALVARSFGSAAHDHFIQEAE